MIHVIPCFITKHLYSNYFLELSKNRAKGECNKRSLKRAESIPMPELNSLSLLPVLSYHVVGNSLTLNLHFLHK